MSTVGIIGGIGPESTIAYYRLLISLYREQTKAERNPHIIINSIDIKRMLDLIGAHQLQKATDYLTAEIEHLANAGAEFCLLAANTPHIVFAQLQAAAPIPLLGIVAETCQYAQSLGLQRVGLFGTKFTMQGEFYQQAFAKEAISLITPDTAAQDYIHEKYMTELVNGIILKETKAGLLAIVETLKTEQHIQGLILGGTELSLILNAGDDRDIPLLDTTRIHAQSAVNELLRLEQFGQ